MVGALAAAMALGTAAGIPLDAARAEPPACTSGDIKTTGGGQLAPDPDGQRSFGFVAGLRSGVPFGHTEFVDHAGGRKIEGTFETYLPSFKGDGASWGGDASMGGRPVGRYT
ncbi:MAG: hypothetical protein LC792_06450, partial [Actinobacteria bacterium]|nr:hypothetical protein [Actinomycetota bacterium]